MNDQAKINTSFEYFVQRAVCVYFKVHSQQIHIPHVQTGGQSLIPHSNVWLRSMFLKSFVVQKPAFDQVITQ